MQAIHLPAVDDQIDQVSQAAKAVTLLSGDDAVLRGRDARAVIVHRPRMGGCG